MYFQYFIRMYDHNSLWNIWFSKTLEYNNQKYLDTNENHKVWMFVVLKFSMIYVNRIDPI